jgi:hypothetical protein
LFDGVTDSDDAGRPITQGMSFQPAPKAIDETRIKALIVQRNHYWHSSSLSSQRTEDIRKSQMRMNCTFR